MLSVGIEMYIGVNGFTPEAGGLDRICKLKSISGAELGKPMCWVAHTASAKLSALQKRIWAILA